MLTLNTCSHQHIISFGQRTLNHYRDQVASFEAAAQASAEQIYDEFREPEDFPTFALVRVFRLTHYDDLLPELQARTQGDSEYWLTLMGTVGDEAAWSDRRSSQAHQVIAPLNASAMFRACFRQLGLPWGNVGEAGIEPEMVEQDWSMRSFYVPQAHDNPLIPDQTNFVAPYGIRSVIGLGNVFISGAGCLILAFSTVPISEAGVARFVELTPYLMTLMAYYDRADILWD